MADGREYAILLLDGSDLPCANEAVLLGWRIGSWIVSIKEERGAGGEGGSTPTYRSEGDVRQAEGDVYAAEFNSLIAFHVPRLHEASRYTIYACACMHLYI